MNTLHEYLDSIEQEIKTQLQLEAETSTSLDVVEYARFFVKLRTLKDRFDAVLKPFDAIYEKAKTIDLPEKFDAARVPTVNLDEGYRVTVSHSLRASVKSGQKEAAKAWLTNNGLGDLITETINASTLSAAAKTMADENKELDEDIFHVFIQPTASVTKTKKG